MEKLIIWLISEVRMFIYLFIWLIFEV